jgi:ABC-type sugar transport system ATPase subunit
MEKKTETPLSRKEAKALLREKGYRVENEDIHSLVCLKDINKIYPNGVQAVYDFNMDIQEHDFIVLVGPSGCGKSTTLRMIAGLEDISSGYLYINRVLANYLPSKDRDISMVFQSYALYPQMTVFDNIAFPLRVRKYDKIRIDPILEANDGCLSLLSREDEVIEGIHESKDKDLSFTYAADYLSTKLKVSIASCKLLLSYGIKEKGDLDAAVPGFRSLREKIRTECLNRKKEETEKLMKEGFTADEKNEVLKDGKVIHDQVKLTKEEIRDKVFKAAEVLDLGPYLDRRPKELSGGQMQRVALGRAIVRDAKIFLMDEPLSNLDAKLRVQMRSEIVRLHERIGATTIYVTHDQTEAMTMATKIAVMSKGWIQQIGEPQEIYNHPKNIFVATFIGSPAMNILDATYQDGKAVLKDGYPIDLPEEFKSAHDQFYQEKIADCERMLKEPTFQKMHGLILHQDLLSALSWKNDEKFIGKLTEFTAVAKEIADEDGKKIVTLLSALTSAHEKDPQKRSYLVLPETKKTLSEIKKLLLHLENVPSADLGKLHNAQIFSKDKKEESETLFYQGRKHEFFWQKKKKNPSAKIRSSSNIVFTNNLYLLATGLIQRYQEALKGPHAIRVGIRPEHLHLSEEFQNANAAQTFTVESDIVELMGSELLLHTEWNGAQLVAKISTGTLVKAHVPVNLTLDRSKVLVFDVNCGDTIRP